MKAKFATSCYVIALLLSPVAAHAAQAADARPDAATAPTPLPALVKDEAMTARIKTRLADEKKANLTQVKVEADRNGSVVLSGKVKTRTDEEKAVSIARDTEGVTLVRSTIQIGKDD